MMPQDVAFLARILKLRCGYVLAPGKHHVLDDRLAAVAARNKFESVSQLVNVLRETQDDTLLAQLVEAIAVAEPVFFDRRAPFESLIAKIVPALQREAKMRGALRIWSAGCGTGQEPYSIAMQLMEHRRMLSGWRVEIVATDPSLQSLKKAAEGQYSQFEVQRGVPTPLLLKYFRKVGWMWQIDESLRAMVDFRQQDLLEDCADLGLFEIVFCRNVLLCLGDAGRRAVLARISRHLRPRGVLVLGRAETAMAASSAFSPVSGLRHVFTRASGNAASGMNPPASVVPLHKEPAH